MPAGTPVDCWNYRENKTHNVTDRTMPERITGTWTLV